MKRNKGFSLLEISLTSFLSLFLLAFLFPNMEMFRQSYQTLQTKIKHRKEKIEFQMLMQQLFEHSVPFTEKTKKAYFILDFPKATWRTWSLTDLEAEGKKEGDSLLLQCIFLEEEMWKKKIFVLVFQGQNLYLAHYRMGYFQEGDRFLLLSDVEGKFYQEGESIVLQYRDKKYGAEEKIYYKS